MLRLMEVQGRHIHVELVDSQLGVVVHPLVDVWPLTEERCHTCRECTCIAGEGEACMMEGVLLRLQHCHVHTKSSVAPTDSA